MSEEQEIEQTPSNLAEVEETPEAPKVTHWPSIAQFGCGSLAVMAAFGGAGAMILSGIFQWFGPLLQGKEMALQSVALAMGGVLVGFLLLPSVGFSFPRAFNTPFKTPGWWPKVRRVLHPKWMVGLIPLGVGVGYFISLGSPGMRFLLPPIHMFLITVMAVWLVWLGVRGLPKGSGQRVWGVVGSGLVLAPLTLLVIEIIVAVIGVVWIVFKMSRDPEFASTLNQLAYYLEQWTLNPEIDLQLVEDIFLRQDFLVGILVFVAVFVPLIEELLKPIGVWFLIGRKLTPKEGFVLGAISGAAYGLFENITSIALDETWAAIVTARLGTSVMHIVTTGLVGWGIASMAKERRFLRFLGPYLAAVLLHGTWNGTAILTAFAAFQVKSSLVLPNIETIGPLILVFLTIAAFVLLKYANRRLRNQPDDKMLVVDEVVIS